jgi:DNA helicase-2/ATP-dependent DNA helicase PcrA
VGVHRLAWLLYHNRDSLKPEDIAIISASALFSSYVAALLPELGERDVGRVALDDLIGPHIPDGYAFTGYYEQAAYMSSAGREDPRARDIAILYSPEFLSYIEAYFRDYIFIAPDVAFRGDVICAAEDLAALAFSGKRRFPFHVTLERVISYIKDHCAEYFKRRAEELRREIERESEGTLFDWEVSERFRSLSFGFTEQVLSGFYASNLLSGEAELYATLLDGFLSGKPEAKSASQRLKKRIEAKSLYYEDLMLILRVKALTGGIQPQTGIKQALLDEAQDYSLPQLLFLKHLYPRANFTILADPYQAIYPVISTPSLDAVAAVFPGAEYLRLENSYRCTGPIFDLARSYAGLPATQGFRREGPEPTVIEGQHADAVAEILSREAADSSTVGVITETMGEARRLYKQLRSEYDIKLISRPGDELSRGITVLPAAFVKGLEFDAAIIAGSFSDWDGRLRGNLMYTLCTRALHRLYLLKHYAP